MFTLLIVAVAAVPVLFYVYWAGKDWWFLDPINTFWPAYLLFGVFQPLAFHSGWIELYGEETVLKTLAMFAVAGLSVCAGYRIDARRSLGLRIPVLRGEDAVGRLIVLGLLLVVFGTMAYGYVIGTMGGVESFLSKSRTNVDYNQISISFLSLLPMLPVGLFILMGTCYAVRSYGLLRHIALALTILWGVWCVYSGTRAGIISTAVILVGTIWGRGRRNPGLWTSVLALSIVLVLVGFATSYRGVLYGGQFNSEDSLTEAIDRSLASYAEPGKIGTQKGAEFSIAQAVVLNVPETVPYDYGRMLLELITRPIPRSVWPEKQYPEGQAWDHIHRVAGTAGWVNNAGYLSGPAPSLVGKYYYMGGILGVILGGLWTGIYLNAIRTYIGLYPPIAQLLLAVGCAELGFNEMNNPLILEYSWLPTVGYGLMLVILLSRGRRRANKRTLVAGLPRRSRDYPQLRAAERPLLRAAE